MTSPPSHDGHGCGCTACRRGSTCTTGPMDPDLAAVIDAWRAALPPGVTDAYFDGFLARVRPALLEGASENPVALAQHMRERVHTARADAIRPRFQQWIATQERAGRRFDFAQREWLEWIARDIAINGSFVMEDFDYTPYVEHGGVGRALRIFGHGGLAPILESMNAALGWRQRTGDPIAALSPLARDVFKLLRYARTSAGPMTPADRYALAAAARAFVEETAPYRPARTEASQEALQEFAQRFVDSLGIAVEETEGTAHVLTALVALVPPDARQAADPPPKPAPHSIDFGISTREALQGRSVERYGPFFHILVHERSQLAPLSPSEARALGDITVDMVDKIRKAARDELLWSDPDLQRKLRQELHDELEKYDLVDLDELDDVVGRIWSLARVSRSRITQEDP